MELYGQISQWVGFWNNWAHKGVFVLKKASPI